ncbi:transcription termination factor NusA [Candidatus Finniella inopinata]|uniref:Transcription termination/antitermination protein NusA n=1 Tax=Candidatus Finniella inopinata TaxID=1696036 RepID=A0A4Q7DHC2_9PROT|nr:transcription termination factor NusA [Candidatus Finniella inopinata]RZI45730.1 transcription termination/antitermination protein NusA [Candidatus Finniella inopinata]
MVSRKIKPVEQVATAQPRHELLQVAEIVAREKGIERDEVLEAMEQAIQKAAKSKYGFEHDIRVEIDRTLGDVAIHRVRTVVDVLEDDLTQITLEEAQKLDDTAAVGDELTETLPPIEFGRVAAQTARQVIVQKVRDAERTRQYAEFKDRVGEIISGLVKRVEFGNVILDLGRAEGVLRREDIIPRETFRTGDRIRVFVAEINPDARTHLIILSRTHPQFMAKMFEQEVPEIYDGVIQIKAVARDPGSRAKIAVYTSDPSIDPVGACVGMRGSRVQAVVNELQGEKVDIIPWSSNPATFVVNALAPAEVMKVVIDEEAQRVDVVVAEDQLSLAIGRRGQNVRLASQLTGWNIDMMTEEDEAKRRAADTENRSQLFMEALDVDEMIAQLLIAEGFSSIEEITQVDLAEFSNVEGFDEEIAQELQNRAVLFLENRNESLMARTRELGVEEPVFQLVNLTPEMLASLAEAKVRTLDEVAELSGDELIEIVGNKSLSVDQANETIMAARAHWFEEDQQ